ncbi:TPA: hypothetical protein ACH3X1_000031 [Trebouxia sp. C0004]
MSSWTHVVMKRLRVAVNALEPMILVSASPYIRKGHNALYRNKQCYSARCHYNICHDAHVPGGQVLEWLSSSPDLSPVENIWAWMDKKLGDRSGIKDTAELQGKLMAVRDLITTKQLSK